MFVILDGEAQFTVDGRTSTLKGPAGAPARMGHAHAIYNATDKPVQWLNINVASFRGMYDNFDLGDDRVGAPLDRGAAVHQHAARSGAAAADRGPPGRHRHGAVSPRARPDRSSSRPGHTSITCCCRLGRRSGPGSEPGIGGFYYVMSGEGTATVAGRPRRSRPATRSRCGSGKPKAFENTGTAPLEFLVVGVARDMNKKNDLLATPPQRLGGPGRAGGAGRGL